MFVNFLTMPLKKKNVVRKIKNFTINFGPQHPAAHGVLRRAGWIQCKDFIQDTSIDIFF